MEDDIHTVRPLSGHVRVGTLASDDHEVTSLRVQTSESSLLYFLRIKSNNEVVVAILLVGDGYAVVSGTVDSQRLLQLVEGFSHASARIFRGHFGPDLQLPL